MKHPNSSDEATVLGTTFRKGDVITWNDPRTGKVQYGRIDNIRPSAIKDDVHADVVPLKPDPLGHMAYVQLATAKLFSSK